MSNEKDENGNLLPDEKRLNGYGKMLRSTSLDELPELFNIFIGNMSIVGPRPQLVCDMVFMSEEVKKRHLVRSGLTGLAQVNGRNNLTWEEKFEYDLKYIQNISLFGDVKIIFQTVIKVLKKSDISRDGMETDINYGDWLLNKGDITKEEYDEKQALAKQLLKG
jgi:lipopolysaccharide/colanic/teichoic acid biosynthesis glycosyltransferase